MYFKKRLEMEAKAQNDRFTTKALELPMVSLGYNQALAYYTRAKEWSPLVHRSFSLAENTVKFAAGTVQPIVGTPLVKADRLAASMLQFVETKCPVIKKTPEEMKKSYYDGSRLQKGIDSANSAKNYGYQQITNTRNAVDFAVHNPTEAAMTTIRYSIMAMNWALDNLESAIDRHVAKPDAKKGPNHEHTTITERLGHMYEKTSDGVKFRSVQHLETLKNSLNEQIKQIHVAMALIEFARRQSNQATKQVENLWEGAKGKSATTTLNTTKFLTQSLAQAIERMSKFTLPFLPETGRKSLTTANDYAKDIARTFNQAETLTDLKEEVVAQAKIQLTAIQNGFMYALDYVLQHLPMDFLNFHLSDLADEDIELLEFNRDHRWVANARYPNPAYHFMNGGTV